MYRCRDLIAFGEIATLFNHRALPLGMITNVFFQIAKLSAQTLEFLNQGCKFGLRMCQRALDEVCGVAQVWREAFLQRFQ